MVDVEDVREMVDMYPVRRFLPTEEFLEEVPSLQRVWYFNEKYLVDVQVLRFGYGAKENIPNDMFLRGVPDKPVLCLVYDFNIWYIEPPCIKGLLNRWQTYEEYDFGCGSVFSDVVWHYELADGYNDLVTYKSEYHPNNVCGRLGFTFARRFDWGVLGGRTIDWFRWNNKVRVFENGEELQRAPEQGKNCYLCKKSLHKLECLESLIRRYESDIVSYETRIKELERLREQLKTIKEEKKRLEKILEGLLLAYD